MANFTIKCEVAEIEGAAEICPGSAAMRRGQIFELGARTPSPEGICAFSFGPIFAAASAMRFAEEIPWERGSGHFDLKCPDGKVTFRLYRETQAKRQ